MLPITDDIIEGLEPSDKRYDVEVEGDLVLSVLPNGSKTWVLVSGRGADARRRSLGVYPDMSVLEACSSARNFWEKDHPSDAHQAEVRYVLRDGQVVAAGPGSKALTLGVAGGLLVLLASGWLIVDTYRNSADDPPMAARATGPATAVAPLIESVTAPPMAARATGPTRAVAPQTESVTAPPAATPATPAEPTPAEPTPAEPTPAEPTLAESTPAEPTLAAPAPRVEPPPAVPGTEPSPAPANPVVAAADEPSPGATDAPIEPPADSVARALLTTEVRNREPVDDLGNSVTASGPERSRVYFFTELRSLGGSTVTHVWERDGEVMAQVPFDVGGWRWRVFSSKDILATEEGRWRVTVVDEDGNVLAERPFEFVAGLPPE